MRNIKQINIKNRTYYFFNHEINIKDSDSNLLKIDKKSYKNIGIYYIGYLTIKDFDHVRINSVNPLYIITGKTDTLKKEYKMRNIKQINIKNRTYFFFNDEINIKDFDSNLLKIDKNLIKILVFITLDI